MALAPGVRLGPYAITAQIGVGGMGEVYRARDTKLDRDVAIKVLPASLAGDPDRIARFQREAKTLAALNHPDISAVYRFERDAIPSRQVVQVGQVLVAAGGMFVCLEILQSDNPDPHVVKVSCVPRARSSRRSQRR